MGDDCVFCRIIAGELPCHRVFEDEHTLAFMDINPVHEGHVLVVPKTHAADLYAADPEDVAAAARSAQRVARAVRAELEPPGLNLLQANGAAAAQSVPHLHIHVLPRHHDDRATLNWPLRPGDPDALAAMAERLRARLRTNPAAAGS